MSHSSSWRLQPSSPSSCPSIGPPVKKMNVSVYSSPERLGSVFFSSTTKKHQYLQLSGCSLKVQDGFSKENQQVASKLFFQPIPIPGSSSPSPIKSSCRISGALYPHPTNKTCFSESPQLSGIMGNSSDLEPDHVRTHKFCARDWPVILQ